MLAAQPGGKSVCYPRKLLGTVSNHFSSLPFFLGLVFDLSLPSVCWQTTTRPNPVPQHISCHIPCVSLPAEAGRQAGRTPSSRTHFPAAFCTDYNPSTKDCTSARAGFPGICLDTDLGIFGPAWEEESKVACFHILLLYVWCKGKTDLGLSSSSVITPQ